MYIQYFQQTGTSYCCSALLFSEESLCGDQDRHCVNICIKYPHHCADAYSYLQHFFMSIVYFECPLLASQGAKKSR